MIIAVAWGVLLAVAAGWALIRGGPTAREQTTVADALPVVDRAVVAVASAATADGQAVAAISGFDRVGDCAVTLVRPGERYQRAVTVVVTPGTESALIERIGARLPAEYHVKVVTGSLPRLVADAGLWVRLAGSVAGRGQVRFVADTGSCRPLGDLNAATTNENRAGGANTDRTPAQAALARLGVSAGQWNTYQAPCPGGGTISTVEAIVSGNVEPGALDELLTGLGPAVVSTPDTYAYTDGPHRVAVRTDAEHLVVTSTTPC